MAGRNAALGGVLLAAGLSRRFGARNKLLMEVEGKPLARRTAEILQNAGIGRMVVVLGHEAREVARALEGLDVELVVNPDFGDGMGTSVSAGASRLVGSELAGALLCVADLPTLDVAAVSAVCRRFWEEGGERIVAPVFEGRRGHPVCFPKRCFSELATLSGDVGAKKILKREGERLVEELVEDGGCVRDLDTQDGESG